MAVSYSLKLKKVNADLNFGLSGSLIKSFAKHNLSAKMQNGKSFFEADKNYRKLMGLDLSYSAFISMEKIFGSFSIGPEVSYTFSKFDCYSKFYFLFERFNTSINIPTNANHYNIALKLNLYI